MKIFTEANELGVSYILLAGGKKERTILRDGIARLREKKEMVFLCYERVKFA